MEDQQQGRLQCPVPVIPAQPNADTDIKNIWWRPLLPNDRESANVTMDQGAEAQADVTRRRAPAWSSPPSLWKAPQ